MAARAESITPNRRADAVRNDERIIAAAIATLSSNPDLGLEEVARAAGVGRTTLHRRYKTRDDLIAKIRVRARDELRRAVRAAKLDEGPTAEALERLIDTLVASLLPYGFLAHNPSPKGHTRDPIVTRSINELIVRGQAEGAFSTALPSEWWVEVIQALLALVFDEPPGLRAMDPMQLIRGTLREGLIAQKPGSTGNGRASP